ncbi:hypothetical protein QR680_015308 [Steinernema hermaphroditum]|uniref:Uncharacterized protein n=1 Tax=Steinernema hermaphroditum TaxID=289476 RepID=A0AA39LKD2_9BILA|nr:hypothetical protein QR680_015308 [Steinernema hermaphroditum]
MTVFSFLFPKSKPGSCLEAKPAPVKHFHHMKITVVQCHDCTWSQVADLGVVLNGIPGNWASSGTISPWLRAEYISKGLILHPDDPFELLIGHDKRIYVCLHKNEFLISLISEKCNFDKVLKEYGSLKKAFGNVLSKSSLTVSARLHLPIIGKQKARLNEVKAFYKVQICDSSNRYIDISSNVNDPLDEAVQKVHSAVDELLMLETTA